MITTPAQQIEVARIECHETQMKWARDKYGTKVICPDCYSPPNRCQHDRPYDRRTT